MKKRIIALEAKVAGLETENEDLRQHIAFLEPGSRSLLTRRSTASSSCSD
jgi:hypothetical protein